jgi:hypothetical protein
MQSRGSQTTTALTDIPSLTQVATDSAAEPAAATGSPKALFRFRNPIRTAFLALVWALAIYQLSETTVDPDLFGHVVFGQQMLKAGAVQKTEIYSWTANGQPFINHEYGADLILGATHLLLGGTGLLLFKLMVGALTFFLSLRLGSKSLSWPASAVAWAVGGVAIVEISFGFAARPQIFTALCLVLSLMILRRIHEGGLAWALALPPLFVFWFNVHGGALAGIGMLLVASTSSTVEFVWGKLRPGTAGVSPARAGVVVSLWLGTLGSFGALFCNPWGATMVRWVIGSVLWLRPEIEEWNPTPFGWDHATMYILVAVAVFAWVASRRRRALWELAVTAAFAVLALRSVRNAPLFAIVALSLTPPHLADALARFRRHFEGLLEFWRRPKTQELAPRFIGMAACCIVVAGFTLHKDHPLTMEIPRAQYPAAAIKFIRAHHLKGKMLTFFDWGDMTIFQLPDCSPSIDGRLDTCYSRELIAQHWKLYNGESVDEKILPIDQADLALLPSALVGGRTLARRPGWKPVYFDGTAVVLVRDVERFASLKALDFPEQGSPESSVGRAAFPSIRTADLAPTVPVHMRGPG